MTCLPVVSSDYMFLRRKYAVRATSTRDSIKDAVTHAFTASLGANICSFGLRRSRAWVQIAAATLAGNSFRQTAHTHRACVHYSAKMVAALLWM